MIDWRSPKLGCPSSDPTKVDWTKEDLGDLTVYLYDFKTGQPEGERRIVYYDAAEISLARGKWQSSGAIYVGNFADKNARLNFVLRSKDGQDVELLIDNVNTFGFGVTTQ